MKLVQDLPEIFEEFGEKKREAFLEIKEYRYLKSLEKKREKHFWK